MIYEWGSNARHTKINAQLVGETVDAISEKHGGVCPPAEFVKAARPKRSPLHPLFTWDDAEEAEKWRRHLARNVINSLVVVIEDGKGSEQRPPAFSHITMQKGSDDQREGYRSTVQVMQEPDLREQAIGEALARLNAVRRRYESLTELADVWSAIDKIAC